jgi:cytidylate kinase
MYRAVALAALRGGVSQDDEARLGELARSLRMEFAPDGDRPRLLMNGEDVSALIRTPELSQGSSRVSQWSAVRAAMVEQQRRMAAACAGRAAGAVMEGRDIGTVVFPDARCKIFLTATPRERARRRAEEMQAHGERVDVAEVERAVIERDRRDMEREHSPLRQAEDAVEVVTDGLTLEQVVERLVALARERVEG